MVTNKFAGDLNPNNVLGAKGYLATSYAELMKSMWFGNNSSVSAIDLKRVIGKFAP
jgi:ubiquitin carboxyl-terminal hydrolase 4/11/15